MPIGDTFLSIVCRVDRPVVVEALGEDALDLVHDGGLDQLVAGEEGASAHEAGRAVLGLDLALDPFDVGVIKQFMSHPTVVVSRIILEDDLAESAVQNRPTGWFLG